MAGPPSVDFTDGGFYLKGQRMSKFIRSLMFLLVSLCLGAVVYQNKLLRDSEERITENVWKEIEYRREIENNIKQGIDTQNKNRDFIMQLEAEKRVTESLKQEIADLEDRQTAYSRKFESSIVKAREEERKRQEGFAEELADYKNKLIEYNVLLRDNIGYVTGHSKRLQENEKNILQLKDRIGLSEKALAGYEAEIAEIQNNFRNLREKQLVSD